MGAGSERAWQRAEVEGSLAGVASRVAGVGLTGQDLAGLRRTLGGLRGLRRLPPGEAARRSGLPMEGLARLRDALDLAEAAALEPDERPTLASPEQVYGWFATLSLMPREEVWLAALDRANRLDHAARVSVGDAGAVVLTPREVLAACLRMDASRVVLLHNHPSGPAEPSVEDLVFTRRLVRAARLMGVSVLDHVVIGSGVWCSLRQRGLIAFES